MATYFPAYKVNENLMKRFYPPSIKVWASSVHKYNNSLIKALPVADNYLFGLIKAYLSISQIYENYEEKKTKLLYRSYKHKSSNRIDVSKPEIKHSADQVEINIYVFNKKKNTYLNKLKTNYEFIMFNRIKANFKKKTQELQNKLYNFIERGRALVSKISKTSTRNFKPNLHPSLKFKPLGLYLNNKHFSSPIVNKTKANNTPYSFLKASPKNGLNKNLLLNLDTKTKKKLHLRRSRLVNLNLLKPEIFKKGQNNLQNLPVSIAEKKLFIKLRKNFNHVPGHTRFTKSKKSMLFTKVYPIMGQNLLTTNSPRYHAPRAGYKKILTQKPVIQLNKVNLNPLTFKTMQLNTNVNELGFLPFTGNSFLGLACKKEFAAKQIFTSLSLKAETSNTNKKIELKNSMIDRKKNKPYFKQIPVALKVIPRPKNLSKASIKKIATKRLFWKLRYTDRRYINLSIRKRNFVFNISPLWKITKFDKLALARFKNFKKLGFSYWKPKVFKASFHNKNFIIIGINRTIKNYTPKYANHLKPFTKLAFKSSKTLPSSSLFNEIRGVVRKQETKNYLKNTLYREISKKLQKTKLTFNNNARGVENYLLMINKYFINNSVAAAAAAGWKQRPLLFLHSEAYDDMLLKNTKFLKAFINKNFTKAFSYLSNDNKILYISRKFKALIYSKYPGLSSKSRNKAIKLNKTRNLNTPLFLNRLKLIKKISLNLHEKSAKPFKVKYLKGSTQKRLKMLKKLKSPNTKKFLKVFSRKIRNAKSIAKFGFLPLYNVKYRNLAYKTKKSMVFNMGLKFKPSLKALGLYDNYINYYNRYNNNNIYNYKYSALALNPNVKNAKKLHVFIPLKKAKMLKALKVLAYRKVKNIQGSLPTKLTKLVIKYPYLAERNKKLNKANPLYKAKKALINKTSFKFSNAIKNKNLSGQTLAKLFKPWTLKTLEPRLAGKNLKLVSRKSSFKPRLKLLSPLTNIKNMSSLFENISARSYQEMLSLPKASSRLETGGLKQEFLLKKTYLTSLLNFANVYNLVNIKSKLTEKYYFNYFKVMKKVSNNSKVFRIPDTSNEYEMLTKYRNLNTREKNFKRMYINYNDYIKKRIDLITLEQIYKQKQIDSQNDESQIVQKKDLRFPAKANTNIESSGVKLSYIGFIYSRFFEKQGYKTRKKDLGLVSRKKSRFYPIYKKMLLKNVKANFYLWRNRNIKPLMFSKKSKNSNLVLLNLINQAHLMVSKPLKQVNKALKFYPSIVFNRHNKENSNTRTWPMPLKTSFSNINKIYNSPRFGMLNYYHLNDNYLNDIKSNAANMKAKPLAKTLSSVKSITQANRTKASAKNLGLASNLIFSANKSLISSFNIKANTNLKPTYNSTIKMKAKKNQFINRALFIKRLSIEALRLKNRPKQNKFYVINKSLYVAKAFNQFYKFLNIYLSEKIALSKDEKAKFFTHLAQASSASPFNMQDNLLDVNQKALATYPEISYLHTNNTMKHEVNLAKAKAMSANNLKAFNTNKQPSAQGVNLKLYDIILAYKNEITENTLAYEQSYIAYLNLINFNKTIFKTWFINPLVNIISRIYNKKVIFNIVSLKYLYYNSDIFTNLITIKINSNKFSVRKVFNIMLRNVALTKVNNEMLQERIKLLKWEKIRRVNMKKKYLKLATPYLPLESSLHTDMKLNNFSILPFNKSLEKAKPYISNTYKYSTLNALNSGMKDNINYLKMKSIFGIKLEAKGRLTQRTTASRSVYRVSYKGNIRKDNFINRHINSVITKHNITNNLSFSKIASKTRNGAFGIKGWINQA